MRGDQRQQLGPWYDLTHLLEQDLCARAAGAQIKANVFLFHAVITRNLRAPVELIEGEF
ncbi:hypothetical protein GCM10011496_38920 [Polaromonas eurypsychrophila]|uniref:Uncharacterized protein n=1 Tax=Polaromonas eurypsychrophila TaxID=1614635 RepID=A0A916SSA4_9BURK|nr:hypothetical protein GCM10011496_38920 [Polaromonas eurypsychrophila]